jgi:hypothetical protein
VTSHTTVDALPDATSGVSTEAIADPLDLVVTLGGISGGELETLMRQALEATALDTIELALASGRVRRAWLLADAQPEQPLPEGVRVEVDDGAFHFGERLARLVGESGRGPGGEPGIQRLLYLGAGAGPLLTAEDVAAFDQPSIGCVTNNAYSADGFALSPASTLAQLDPAPRSDNEVPRRLSAEVGVGVVELERTIATQFNLDAPIDLAALALAGGGGPRLRRCLEAAALDTDRLAAAARTFTDRRAEVLVAGRVSARTWRYLERDTPVRVRLLSEERGMVSAGTEADGSARSMLGQLIEAVGPERAFSELLPDLGQAAFIDIRPALVQLGIRASRADRYAADLGRAELVEDVRLRAIVEAAAASPIPVILGGHSLVTGGLMLLNQWAWDEHDRARGLDSDPSRRGRVD